MNGASFYVIYQDPFFLRNSTNTKNCDLVLFASAAALLHHFSLFFCQQISSANPKDEGWYDCQVNTEPKVNFKSYLRILPLPKSRNKQGKQSSAALFPASASKDGSLQDAPADIRPQVIPQIQEFLQSFSKLKILGHNSQMK